MPPSVAAAVSVVSLAAETARAAAAARAGDRASVAAAGPAAAPAATGRVSAVESAAASVSFAPEAAVPSSGLDEDLWLMRCPVPLLSMNLAAKADGSIAECLPKAGCMQQPAVGCIHSAAAASASASPSARGRSELLCTPGGCSWGRAPRRRAAAAAKASVCCTLCSREACSVLAATLGTAEAEPGVELVG